jgi:uncharacterized protein (TIGR02145 family)
VDIYPQTETKMRQILLMCICILGFFLRLSANDVRIKGEAKVQALGDDIALISFPIAWDHSWRAGENWDAVYIFVKYRRRNTNSQWYHAYLNVSGHRCSQGGGVPPMEFLSITGGKQNSLLREDVIYYGNYEPTKANEKEVVQGVLLFRRTPGYGNLDISRVTLEWDFSQGELNLFDAITLDDIRANRVEVSIQAIEMVYVPNGPYRLGDRFSKFSFISESGTNAMFIESEEEMQVQHMGMTPETINRKWKLSERYPKGYTGYYITKYETSQEQYVNFLNRLPYVKQAERIGADLNTLKPGMYAFGSRRHAPSYRNGIILQERFATNDTAVVFGFNLNPDDLQNSELDGKSIACNFLTPSDALAYADWIGLRPLSEMEYEKGSRERNPLVGYDDRSLAWGNPMATSLVSWGPGHIKDIYSEKEAVIYPAASEVGRMNGPRSAAAPGPVRCGAFADETPDMYSSGASRWGIMEMSGNLAEIYYNAYHGREFNGQAIGDGNIYSSVAVWRLDTTVQIRDQFHVGYGYYTVMSERVLDLPLTNKKNHPMKAHIRQQKDGYCESHWGCWVNHDIDITIPWPALAWPTAKESFMLRGGSFATEAQATSGGTVVYDNMAVSYRGDTIYDRTDSLALRFEYSTFRVGVPVEMKSMRTGVIRASNGLEQDTAVICRNAPYTITEVEGGDDTHETTIFSWEINDGTGWKTIPNSNHFDLTIDDCLVSGAMDDCVQYGTPLSTYRFRRKSISSHAEAYGNEVTVMVPGFQINGSPELNSLMIDMYDSQINVTTLLGIKGNVKMEWQLFGTSTWRELDNQTGQQQIVQTISRDALAPDITLGEAGKGLIRITATFGGCTVERTLDLAVRKPAASCPTTVPDIKNPAISYRVAQLSDGKCWMLDDLRVLVNGKSGSYNWTDMKDIAENQLCPDGFRVPEEFDWDYLWRMTSTLLTISGGAETCDWETQDYVPQVSQCEEMNGFWGLWWPGVNTFAQNLQGSVPTVDGETALWWANGNINYKRYINLYYYPTELELSGVVLQQDYVGTVLRPIRCVSNPQ